METAYHNPFLGIYSSYFPVISSHKKTKPFRLFPNLLVLMLSFEHFPVNILDNLFLMEIPQKTIVKNACCYIIVNTMSIAQIYLESKITCQCPRGYYALPELQVYHF